MTFGTYLGALFITLEKNEFFLFPCDGKYRFVVAILTKNCYYRMFFFLKQIPVRTENRFCSPEKCAPYFHQAN